FGSHAKICHRLSIRGPSQKLSKPAPNNRFGFMPTSSCHSAVRPVMVGSRPIDSTRNDATFRNRTAKANDRSPATAECTRNGRWPRVGLVVRNKIASAIAKDDSADTELD